MDGHGSHINMRFLNWAIEHRILVAAYPPHSTHRLQPLDVSLFGPLATFYSQELDQFIFESQGLCGITKRDFFRLFFPAWERAFSVENINSGFTKTGIYPLDASPVLTAVGLPVPEPPNDERPSSRDSKVLGSSAISVSNWRKIRLLLKEVVTESLSTELT